MAPLILKVGGYRKTYGVGSRSLMENMHELFAIIASATQGWWFNHAYWCAPPCGGCRCGALFIHHESSLIMRVNEKLRGYYAGGALIYSIEMYENCRMGNICEVNFCATPIFIYLWVRKKIVYENVLTSRRTSEFRLRASRKSLMRWIFRYADTLFSHFLFELHSCEFWNLNSKCRTSQWLSAPSAKKVHSLFGTVVSSIKIDKARQASASRGRE